MVDDEFIRDMIDADLLPKADYFKLEKEIDAMMQGLYFKAKKSKRPYKDVIDDYLATQPINAEEKEVILNLWRKRNKALNLPVFEWKEVKRSDDFYLISSTLKESTQQNIELNVLYNIEVEGNNYNLLDLTYLTESPEEEVIPLLEDIVSYYINETNVEGVIYNFSLLPEVTNIHLFTESALIPEGEDVYSRDNKNKVMNENEGMASLYTIYLDMDGVIVDFDKQFEDAFDMPPREFEKAFGAEMFWKKIEERGVGFWRGMDWMPGGQELYNRVSQYNHYLLSSPSRSDTSKIGKHMWKKDNTPNTKLILARSYNKKNYADKSNILIDDREDNIQQWRDAGGIGILYKSASQVNKELDKLGL